MKLADEGVEKGLRGVGEDDVVYTNQKQNGSFVRKEDKEGEINLRLSEMAVQEESAKFFIPCSSSLFKAIKNLTKPTNMIRELRMNVTLWLRNVDFFFKGSMKEGVADV